jgi:hypothetical protein
MVSNWLKISVFFLVIAGVMGCLLRLYYVGVNPGLVFGNLLHAHSHTAMMGWIYVAITSLIYHHFINKQGYKTLFAVTIGSVFGLMVSFSLQGYAFFSIVFCCVHLICSYVFTYKTLKDIREEKTQGAILLRTSLYLLLLSTFGIWTIGPAIALCGKESSLFSVAIQFYLHFQFNGFFYFAASALLFKVLEIKASSTVFRSFFVLTLAATFLSMALPLSWYYPGSWWYILQTLGSFLQGYALLRLLLDTKDQLKSIIKNLTSIEKTLVAFSSAALVLKTLLPLFMVYPDLMRLSHEIRSITVAYLHMLMLGLISGFLVFIKFRSKFFSSHSSVFQCGVWLFILGFLLTESILFFQGIQVMFHLPAWKQAFSGLAVSSIFLPLGAFCWLFSFKKS